MATDGHCTEMLYSRGILKKQLLLTPIPDRDDAHKFNKLILRYRKFSTSIRSSLD